MPMPIADFAACANGLLQFMGRQGFQPCPQPPGQRQREARIRLESWVPLAIIVVHRAGANAAEQAGEMIEAMPGSS